MGEVIYYPHINMRLFAGEQKLSHLQKLMNRKPSPTNTKRILACVKELSTIIRKDLPEYTPTAASNLRTLHLLDGYMASLRTLVNQQHRNL